MTQSPQTTHFGNRAVTPEEKTSLVHGVFDNVADKYDIMNDLMSGGLHRLWKNRLIREIRPKAHYKYLDVAGGTGDIAFRLRKKLGPSADITLCDLTHHMLKTGRERAIDKGWLNDFKWSTGNAQSLPFPDNSFDIYTISFGLRNVVDIDQVLREARRILKPGGRFFCLEFSRVNEPLLRNIYDTYSFNLIPKIGKAITNDAESYQYLVESIRKFPSQGKVLQIMDDAKFENCRARDLSMGIVAIHTGTKIS